MKKLLFTACAFFAYASILPAQSLYWDSNGSTAGAGTSPAGTWGSDLFWNEIPDGTGTPGAWTSGSTAVFSAGTDATGSYIVTVSGNQTVGKIVVEEGTPAFKGGTLTLNGEATIQVASGRTTAFDTTVLAGSAGLSKTGAGTLVISNITHTFTGGITVKEGVLQTGGNGAANFGNAANTITMDGGELRTTLTRTTVNPLVILKDTTFSKDSGGTARTVTFTNSVTISPGVTIRLRNPAGSAGAFNLRFTGGLVSDANWEIGQAGDGLCQLQFMGNTNWPDQVISGTISGPGILRRTSTASGIGAATILTGDNVYTGGTEINGGMIGFGRSSTGNPVTSGPIGTGTLTLLDDSVIGFFAHGGDRTIGNAVVFNNVAFDLQIPGEHDLTLTGPINLNSTARSIVVTSSGLTTFAGPISGTAAITKKGSGVLAWSGNNINSGNITVSEGTFLVNNTFGSGTGSGSVTVNNGAVLGGTGFIGGPVNVSGSVAPGNGGIGKLTFNNGANLSGATVVWELGANSETDGTYDQIVVAGGDVALGGSSVLAVNFTGTATAPSAGNAFWQSARSWVVVKVIGGSNSGLTGFSSITGTEAITAGTFSTSVDGNGNVLLNYTPADIVIPEPIIENITGAGTSAITISWTAVEGVQYRLEYKDDLSDPDWTEVDSVVATGTTASLTDENASSNTRFYRVRVD